MKNIVVIGGGNHANCVIDTIEKENKYNIVGIIDSINDIGTQRFGYKIIGRQEDIDRLINEYSIYGGIIAVGDNWSRYKIYEGLIKLVPKFQFINAIHPSAIIGNNVEIGIGVTVMACVVLNPNTKIGNFTMFLPGAKIEHDCTIFDFVSVSVGSITGGYVKIGKFSAITLGVTILDRLEIGENTVVGSGSLVLKSLPSDVLVYGNPAKIIRNREIGEKFLK